MSIGIFVYYIIFDTMARFLFTAALPLYNILCEVVYCTLVGMNQKENTKREPKIPTLFHKEEAETK